MFFVEAFTIAGIATLILTGKRREAERYLGFGLVVILMLCSAVRYGEEVQRLNRENASPIMYNLTTEIKERDFSHLGLKHDSK